MNNSEFDVELKFFVLDCDGKLKVGRVARRHCQRSCRSFFIFTRLGFIHKMKLSFIVEMNYCAYERGIWDA